MAIILRTHDDENGLNSLCGPTQPSSPSRKNMPLPTTEQLAFFDADHQSTKASAEPLPEQPATDACLDRQLAGRRASVTLADQGVFRAVSPLANTLLREVCTYCRAEILGLGFVILDYDDLGAFCNEECADRGFRLYLYDFSYEPE